MYFIECNDAIINETDNNLGLYYLDEKLDKISQKLKFIENSSIITLQCIGKKKLMKIAFDKLKSTNGIKLISLNSPLGAAVIGKYENDLCEVLGSDEIYKVIGIE